MIKLDDLVKINVSPHRSVKVLRADVERLRSSGGCIVKLALELDEETLDRLNQLQLNYNDDDFLFKFFSMLEPRHPSLRLPAPEAYRMPNVQNLPPATRTRVKPCYSCARAPERCTCPKGLVPQ